MHRARILIVDDEADICTLLSEALASDQWTIEWTTRPLEALDRVKSELYELILLDIKMPEISGLELLPKLKKASPESAIMIMSAFGNVSIAVQAMKEGAEDYLEKPFRDFEPVRLAVAHLVDTARTRTENRHLKQQLEERFKLDGLVSASPLMQEVFDLVKKVAPIPTTVLITGETGTGKELIARTLHSNSKRANGPFISVNSGGLPEGLLESLIFGHEKGAFTGAIRRTRGYFEEAEGGTLFLDEIGDMPSTLQVKLLRVLQERTFQRVGGTEELTSDVRLIAATNKDLEREVVEQNFRLDLFYRLNVITISLPALRDRPEDIPLLVRYFTEKYSKAFGRPGLKLAPKAINHLCSFNWPGNVRELENTIERVIALAEGTQIDIENLCQTIPGESEDWVSKLLQLSLREARHEFEKRYLLENLRLHDGSVTQAAQSAGLPRQNYHRKMKQLGLPTSRKLAELTRDDSDSS
jgi:DNA-binding NtrC family response regulator